MRENRPTEATDRQAEGGVYTALVDGIVRLVSAIAVVIVGTWWLPAAHPLTTIRAVPVMTRIVVMMGAFYWLVDRALGRLARAAMLADAPGPLLRPFAALGDHSDKPSQNRP